MSSKQLITTTILLLLLLTLPTQAKKISSTNNKQTITADDITICHNEACTITYDICNNDELEYDYTPLIITKATVKKITTNDEEQPHTQEKNINKATTKTLPKKTCQTYNVNIKPIYGTTTKYDINWLDPFITTLTYESNFTSDVSTATTNYTETHGLTNQIYINQTENTSYNKDGSTAYSDVGSALTINNYVDRIAHYIKLESAAGQHSMLVQAIFTYANGSTGTAEEEYHTAPAGTWRYAELHNPNTELNVTTILWQYKQSTSSTGDIFVTNRTIFIYNTSKNNYTTTNFTAATTIEYFRTTISTAHNTTTSDYNLRISCNNATNWTNNIQNNTVTACNTTGTGLQYNIVLNNTAKPYTTITAIDIEIIKGRLVLTFNQATTGEVHWVGGGTNFTNTTTLNTTLYNAEEGYVTVTFNKNTYNEYQQEYTFYYDGTTDVTDSIRLENATTARPIRTFITGSTTPAPEVKVTLKKILDGNSTVVQQVYTNTYGEGSILVIPGSAYNYQLTKDGYTTGTGTISVGYTTDAIVFSIATTTATISTVTYATNLTHNQRSNNTNYVEILSSQNNYNVNINITQCTDGSCLETNNDYTTDEGARTDFTVANGTDTVQVKITIDGTLRINEIYTMRDSINQTTTTTEDTEGISPGDETTWELNPFQGIIIITITSIIAGLWMESKRKGWGLWTTIISISIFGYIYPILWLITGGFGALFTYQLFRKTINGE